MTVWIFQFMGVGWKRKTLVWYNRFLAGEEKVIGAELKVAHVYVETEERQPSKLRLLSPPPESAEYLSISGAGIGAS